MNEVPAQVHDAITALARQLGTSKTEVWWRYGTRAWSGRETAQQEWALLRQTSFCI